jgi:signal transduction histidine kinase
MTIRKKINLCMAFAISLAVATTLVVFYRGQLLKESAFVEAFFDQVIQGTSELNYLARGDALYQGDRYRTQWHQRHASLEKLLTGVELKGDDDKAALLKMLQDMGAIKGLFEQIVSNYDSARRLAGVAREMKLESNKRATARLLARIQVMGNDAAQLAETNNRRIFIVQKRVFLTILTLSLSMILVIAFIALVLSRNVMGGLTALKEGAEAVSRGDLDHRIAIRSPDEIGQVSRAFNDMTAKLKGTYRELQQSRDELEQRVQVRTEKLQERTEQLADANRELESFSYSVSHDLQSPLRAIDGYSRMILRKHADRFDEDALAKFNVIRANAQMMGRLIDDLLAFSRLGKAHLSIASLKMDVMVREVWEEILAGIPERRLRIVIGEMPQAEGDRGLIRQVLVNLLSNAVKFTRQRPEALIEVFGHVADSQCIYTVRDNGVGFDMQYHDKIFGVFQRLHGSDEFEGTGVGLAIVQRILARHGGRVWAEGKVDEGACFYFILPGGKIDVAEGSSTPIEEIA